MTKNEILDRLEALQKNTAQPLITEEEVCIIRDIWAHELVADVDKPMTVRVIGKAKDAA